MKITVSRNELYHKLKLAGRITRPAKTVSHTENFRWRMDEDTVVVTATDIYGAISAKINCEAGEMNAETFCIQADRFLSALSNLAEQPLRISTNANNMRVEHGSGSFEVPLLDASSFPEIASDKKSKTISCSSDNLRAGILKCLPNLKEDELRPILGGMLIEITNGGINCVGTDATQMVHCYYPQSAEGAEDGISATLPQAACKIIASMLESTTDRAELKVSATNITVSDDEIQLTYRLLEGKYPNYKAVFPNGQHRIEIDTKLLIGALSRLVVFTEKASSLVRFSISKNALTITGSDIEYKTSAKETHPVLADFEMEIGLNANRMIQLLRVAESGMVTLAFDSATRPVVIEDGQVRMLLMPMML